ncbi:DUF3140 domain-containing protein [Streptosporangium subroseum]|uniref:DUF3140 domain-containing protein n=1 Tax=Streptosporangium subroseum TaxID=106412 RepID=UPI00308B9DD0|nr:DUF3140 domain-containing protein [Streptosporangium subroseum]
MAENSDLIFDLVWQEFHEIVNMTSDELRAFLLASGSGEVFPGDPESQMPELGRQVLRVLGKRKVDLTQDDIETMQRAIDRVEDALTDSSFDAEDDDDRRRALLEVGHNPLRPSRMGI